RTYPLSAGPRAADLQPACRRHWLPPGNGKPARLHREFGADRGQAPAMRIGGAPKLLWLFRLRSQAVTETSSHHQSAGQPPEGLAARQVRTSRGGRRSGWLVTVVVAVAAAGVLSAWRAGWLSPAGSSGPG